MSADLAAYWKKVARAQDFHVRVAARAGLARAVNAGKDAIVRNRGDVLDFRRFGDLALSIIVEMDGSGVLSLLDELEALGWDVDVNPDRETLAGLAGDLLEGTFQLTFPEGGGELRLPTPAVPG
jgi:hypothetical protein